MRHVAFALIVAVLYSVSPASAQFLVAPKGPAVRLQIVFERFAKDKKVSSVPYTVSLIALAPNDNVPGGLPSRVRAGVQVPMRYETTGADKQPVPGNVVYRDVGDAIECRASSREDGRFTVHCVFEQSSVGSPGDPPASPASNLLPPVIRTFRSEASLVLADGQTVRHSAGIDRVTGETVNIDVTLTAMK
jgi:hypothetical protein